MVRKFLAWLTEESGSHLVGAILASSVVTSAVSALVRTFTTLSWESSWVLWTGTAFVTYVAALKTARLWMPAPRPLATDRSPSESSLPVRLYERVENQACWIEVTNTGKTDTFAAQLRYVNVTGE